MAAVNTTQEKPPQKQSASREPSRRGGRHEGRTRVWLSAILGLFMSYVLGTLVRVGEVPLTVWAGTWPTAVAAAGAAAALLYAARARMRVEGADGDVPDSAGALRLFGFAALAWCTGAITYGVTGLLNAGAFSLTFGDLFSLVALPLFTLGFLRFAPLPRRAVPGPALHGQLRVRGRGVQRRVAAALPTALPGAGRRCGGHGVRAGLSGHGHRRAVPAGAAWSSPRRTAPGARCCSRWARSSPSAPPTSSGRSADSPGNRSREASSTRCGCSASCSWPRFPDDEAEAGTTPRRITDAACTGSPRRSPRSPP